MATSHLKAHPINETADHTPGTNGTLLGTESSAIVEKAFGNTATANLIAQRTSTGQLTVPLVPVAIADAASKQFVLNTALSGTSWKELVLVSEQLLSGGSGAVLQGILATLAVNLATGDSFTIEDGVAPETFIADTDFAVGGSAAATQTNLVAAINGGTLWSAVETTGLDDYFAGVPASQFVIYRKANSSNADRIFGTIAGGQTAIKVVEFGTAESQDYQDVNGVESDLPGSDPAAKRFGFGRAFAALTQNETHRVAEDNLAFTWDNDDNAWQQTETGFTTTAGDGIDVTGGKVSTKTATSAAEQQYGGLVNTRSSDAASAAGADAGYNAVKADFVDLAVDATNALIIKTNSRLDRAKGSGTWASTSGSDKEPDLTELNAALGTAAGDIGNWCFMVQTGAGTGSDSTFMAYKKANAGTLADYHLVELS